MTIIINVPFLVHALLVASLKKVKTPSHCTTGLGFCHTVLFKEQPRMFLASPKHSLDTKISSSNVLTRNILVTILAQYSILINAKLFFFKNEVRHLQ